MPEVRGPKKQFHRPLALLAQDAKNAKFFVRIGLSRYPSIRLRLAQDKKRGSRCEQRRRACGRLGNCPKSEIGFPRSETAKGKILSDIGYRTSDISLFKAKPFAGS
jgi:hypothetical protein